MEEIALFNKIKDMIRPLFPRLFGTSKEKFDIYNSPQLDPQVVQILRTQLKHFWRVKLTEWMKSEIYSYIIQDVE